MKCVAQLQTRESDQDRRDLANCYSNLAVVEHSSGNLDQAYSFMLKAVAARRSLNEHNNITMADQNLKLATIVGELGDLKRARLLMLDSIRDRKMSFPSRHPAMAESYSALSQIEHRMGNFTEARSLMKKAVATFWNTGAATMPP